MQVANHYVVTRDLGVAAVALVVAATLGCALEAAVVSSDVATPQFDGDYVLDTGHVLRTAVRQMREEPDPRRRASLQALTVLFAQSNRLLRIRSGIIRISGLMTQEFSIQTATTGSGVLRGTAIWHEDIHDPGDMSEVEVQLRIKGDQLTFTFGDGALDSQEPMEYIRRR